MAAFSLSMFNLGFNKKACSLLNGFFSKAILERIVGTKSKTYLADEFKKAFAEKYGIKKEEMKREVVDKIYNNKEKVEK